MKRPLRIVFLCATVILLLIAVVLARQYLDESGSNEVATAVTDPVAQRARGSYLATAGDCMACHTKRGGAAYAGGRAIPTPFGTLYTPNITPDITTGIGTWTATDFWRAMHNGKSKDGHLLYPAFPYPNYTKVTRTDSDALYTYLKALPAEQQRNHEHALNFPYNLRILLTVWRALYFRPGTYRADTSRTVAWNRGAYLVQGLGHCAACHTNRNALGAPEQSADLAGGLIPLQGWYAPSLTSDTEAGLGSWDRQHIVALLGTGISPRATVFGPMAVVVGNSLQHLNEGDVGAMATYLQSLPQTISPYVDSAFAVEQGDVTATLQLGTKLYGDQCASCHRADGRGMPPAYPPLAGNRALTMASPVNPIRMILNGGFPPGTHGNPRPYGMPPFGPLLSDAEVAAVTSYIRQSWGNKASLVAPTTVSRYRSIPLE